MGMKVKTTLRRVAALYPTAESWADELEGSEADMEDYRVLAEAESNQEQIWVTALSCDGYFDITVGARDIASISAIHLNGFTEDGHLEAEAVLNGTIVDGIFIVLEA